MASPPSTSTNSELRGISGWKRVAWPELRILPLKVTSEALPVHIQQVLKDILRAARVIVEKHGFLPKGDEEIHVNLGMRRQEPYGPRIPTVVVVAPWSPEIKPVWEKAVHEMAVFLTEFSKTSSISQGDIHVEIIAPELKQPIYYTSIDEPDRYEAWDKVRGKVHDCLESFEATKGRLSTIALWKYGVLSDGQANPPTIYISVFNESDETGWYEVIAAIKNMLEGVGWNHVQIHMEHNEGWQEIFD
ncbi:hypothetical protein FSARC_10875 [Fusarium sarcochroum]|uniref:Uncharacterized protein n=1 Tax=Fusarium sarcochroum TaxID=1208366 RepID=A0A8H4TJC8_9HYPO|nr:hypothetical protein FSARC_10875 [Fusarium sarcochroum]